MAADVPAKKLRLSGEASEQGMENDEEKKPMQPLTRILQLDLSKYSASIQKMTDEELLQTFNIGVAVKESFTLSILENSSFVKEELGKQMNPIHNEMKNLPLAVEKDMLKIRDMVGESLLANNTEMARRVDDLTTNLLNNIYSVSSKVLPVAEMETRISNSVREMEMRTGRRMEAITAKIDGLAQEFQKPAKKGIVSENTVHSILRRNFPHFTFNDVSRERRKGDIRLSTTEGYQVMIEVKNYQASVPKTEIDKFKNNVLSDDVKVGVMLSVRSGIAMKCKSGKFEVNHVDGKYMIYVSSALAQTEVMIWSVFLATELAGLDVELKDNQAKKLQKLCESFQEKMKYVKTCRDRIVTLNNAIKGLEESIEPIFEIIQDAGRKLKAILKDSSQDVRPHVPQPQPYVID